VTIDWTHVRHFSMDEFAEPDKLRWDMLRMLDNLRENCGFPMYVTSSYRDPAHNAAVGGVSDSSHCLAPDGLYSGVDISITDGARMFKAVKGALALGFNRIGVYPKHVHLDIEGRLPQNVIWTGSD